MVIGLAPPRPAFARLELWFAERDPELLASELVSVGWVVSVAMAAGLWSLGGLSFRAAWCLAMVLVVLSPIPSMILVPKGWDCES